MPIKYVFVTGGVVSGLGKGITAASLGRLLKMRGYKVTSQKFDPYINMDPGTMNPIQHGEVFVTDDGAETDLDLGHYERFIDEKELYKIYLYAYSTRVSEPRLLRRLVRDFHYRDASAEVTFSMWESVKKGEVENIEPFAETADLKINTYFHYEKSCFVNDAREILSLLPQNSVYRPMADAILGQLAGVEQIDIGLVPENSLLWEFLKR